MNSYRFYGFSVSARRRFSAWGALCGDHRPSRVAVYGATCLIAYTTAMVALVRTGAVVTLATDLERLAGRAAMRDLPTGITLGYGLLWVWFLISLWNCAPNAHTRLGGRFARGACVALAFLIAAACVVLAGGSGST